MPVIASPSGFMSVGTPAQQRTTATILRRSSSSGSRRSSSSSSSSQRMTTRQTPTPIATINQTEESVAKDQDILTQRQQQINAVETIQQKFISAGTNKPPQFVTSAIQNRPAILQKEIVSIKKGIPETKVFFYDPLTKVKTLATTQETKDYRKQENKELKINVKQTNKQQFSEALTDKRPISSVLDFGAGKVQSFVESGYSKNIFTGKKTGTYLSPAEKTLSYSIIRGGVYFVPVVGSAVMVAEGAEGIIAGNTKSEQILSGLELGIGLFGLKSLRRQPKQIPLKDEAFISLQSTSGQQRTISYQAYKGNKPLFGIASNEREVLTVSRGNIKQLESGRSIISEGKSFKFTRQGNKLTAEGFSLEGYSERLGNKVSSLSPTIDSGGLLSVKTKATAQQSSFSAKKYIKIDGSVSPFAEESILLNKKTTMINGEKPYQSKVISVVGGGKGTKPAASFKLKTARYYPESNILELKSDKSFGIVKEIKPVEQEFKAINEIKPNKRSKTILTTEKNNPVLTISTDVEISKTSAPNIRAAYQPKEVKASNSFSSLIFKAEQKEIKSITEQPTINLRSSFGTSTLSAQNQKSNLKQKSFQGSSNNIGSLLLTKTLSTPTQENKTILSLSSKQSKLQETSKRYKHSTKSINSTDLFFNTQLKDEIKEEKFGGYVPRIYTDKEKRKGKLFSLSVKEKGKFKNIGIFKSYKSAFSVGREKVDKSLSASFMIKGAGGGYNLSPKTLRAKQTNKGTIFIERSKYRINTPTEKYLLKRSKRFT